MAKKKNTSRADGRIAVQIYLGIVDGKRKYKTVYGKTQKEADEKALQIKLSMKKGLDVLSDQDTFEKWKDIFLESKKLDVSQKQAVLYKGYTKHLAPLSFMPISKIKTVDIQQIINRLAETNPTTHKPTAKKTLKDIKGTAAQILALAVDARVIDYNPALSIKIPLKAPQSKRRALTATEQEWINNTVHPMQIGAMIMMYAGLRRGELIPLTWNDIDLKNRVIDVNKAVEIENNRPKLKDIGKSSASIRKILVPKKLCDYLETIPNKQGLVLKSKSGEMLTETAWRRLWDSYMAELNFLYGSRQTKAGTIAKSKYNPHGLIKDIPPITPHYLRHTFATLLYLSGVDILTAKEQLGHEDVKTTLQIYTHLDKLHKSKSVAKLDEYLADASQMQVK